MELQLGLALFPDINKFEMNKESTSEPQRDMYGSGHTLHPNKRNFNEAFDRHDSFVSTTDDIPRTLALFSWDNDDAKKDGEDVKPSYSLYVKVKMEGVPIARKVDLGQHQSYHSLATTLLRMFGKSEENMKDYKLTYQDDEGDWLLAEDLPWKSFMESVQCLKWIKSSHPDRDLD
ncbi:auxin-induced protein 22A [Daucus carota subsp. sativus]|uniref:auxin-induced protein 22A n=1 Tax=Daucus carota subsp. sativus TaxID=79200 RepID=UPI0007B1948C|nr:PREDICTED: auxin-induced protein 22A-like [Daucus carota subsp. sativus]